MIETYISISRYLDYIRILNISPICFLPDFAMPSIRDRDISRKKYPRKAYIVYRYSFNETNTEKILLNNFMTDLDKFAFFLAAGSIAIVASFVSVDFYFQNIV